jgi:hypothetical protein
MMRRFLITIAMGIVWLGAYSAPAYAGKRKQAGHSSALQGSSKSLVELSHKELVHRANQVFDVYPLRPFENRGL